MAHHNCNAPCFVPPHPELLARTKVGILNAENPAEAKADKKASSVLHGEKGVPGMNDGTIFPRSHYAEPTSIMEMSNAALKRNPLRGTVR
jgi:immune inhibitor A